MTLTLDRNLHIDVENSTKSGQTIAVPLLYINFASPTLAKHYAGSNVDVVVSSSAAIPAETYIGVGGISTIAVAEESVELKSTKLTVELNGLDSTDVALVLAEPYYGKEATLALAILNNDYQVLGDPIVLFKGFCSIMRLSLDTKASISMDIESILANWERPRVKRYNSADRGTDTGFGNIVAGVSREVIWGR